MQREETRIITTCDHCGKEIPGSDMDSLHTNFTRPDLDYFHGIWMGDVGEHYVGGKDEKHFCDIECLFEDIRRVHDAALAKKEGA